MPPAPASSPPGASGPRFYADHKTAWWIFFIGLPITLWAGYAIRMGPSWGAVPFGMQLDFLSNALFTGAVAFIGGFAIILALWMLGRFFDVALALLSLFLIYLALQPGLTGLATGITGFFGFLVGVGVGIALLFPFSFSPPTTFGSARWARADDLAEAGLFADTAPAARITHPGFSLGVFPVPGRTRRDPPVLRPLAYRGDRHLLTVAPTRSGKGVSAIIPNLLTYPGSALVVDPKGENARITAEARAKLGHAIRIMDPWGLVADDLGMMPASLNPMDWLDPDDPDLIENGMILADALVLKSSGDSKFWDEEAKAMLMGLILYVATDEDEQERRTLARVRDLLTLSGKDIKLLFERMSTSPIDAVATSGNRALQKDDKTLANVLASAQAHTHFLDSPRMRRSLETGDFDFASLKDQKITIYLVLPADRLETFGRWLRLLIQQAITENARNIEHKPAAPILFMLDELPALGSLTMVEQAYGLMAGFGMQLWGIVQDISQLERIYGNGWQTFIANSGVVQYFGSRDEATASYFSKLAGVTTLQSISQSVSHAVSSAVNGGSTTTTTGETVAPAQRHLVYPDELMRMAKDKQLLFVENLPAISARKVEWFSDPTLKLLGKAIGAPITAPEPALPPPSPQTPAPIATARPVEASPAFPLGIIRPGAFEREQRERRLEEVRQKLAVGRDANPYNRPAAPTDPADDDPAVRDLAQQLVRALKRALIAMPTAPGEAIDEDRRTRVLAILAKGDQDIRDQYPPEIADRVFRERDRLIATTLRDVPPAAFQALGLEDLSSRPRGTD